MTQERDMLWRWIWVMTFGIAFAWVEGSVVIYLRKIYFNSTDFSFPLLFNWKDGEPLFDYLIRIEYSREIATILMLVSIGAAAGKNILQKFSFFLIAFGIWDIFYYAWLWVMARWPESLMTWDLLFYVPLPWVGPVITPVLIAVFMVAGGTYMIYCDEKNIKITIRWYDWLTESFFGLLMIIAFCWDYKNIMRIPDGVQRSGIPNPFAWWLYIPAYLGAVIYFIIRMKQMIASQDKTRS